MNDHIFTPKVLESKGKTIDEAIYKGISQMELSIDEVDIQTIQAGSKGILGIGAKPYIVKITQKKPEQSDNILETEMIWEKTVAIDENKNSLNKDNNDSNELEYTDYKEDKTNVGAQFLDGLLTRMNISASIKFCESDSSIRFILDSKDSGILIGHRGETLDAIQYLSSLIINQASDEYKNVIIDTENYRKKREQSLAQLARKMADQVQKTRRNFVFEPMNPYERRILHSTLQDFPKVRTYSEGEGNTRHVIIALKDVKENI